MPKAFSLSPEVLSDIENNANLNIYEPLWFSDNLIKHNVGNLGRVRNIRKRRLIHEIKAPDLSLKFNLQGLQELASKSFHSLSKDIIETSTDNPNKFYYLEPKLETSLITGGKDDLTMYFGFEAFSRNEFLTIEDEQKTKLGIYQGLNYSSFSFGLAKTSQNGIFNAGILIRPNFRMDYFPESSKTLNELQTKDFIKRVYKESIKTVSLAADAGVIINMGDTWLPSISLSVKNIPTGCQSGYRNPFTQKTETVFGAVRVHFDSSSNKNLLLDPMNVSAELSMTPRFRMGRLMFNLKFAAGLNTIPFKIGKASFGLDYGNESLRLLNAYTEFLLGNPLGTQKQFFSARVGLFHGEMAAKLLMFLEPFSVFYELFQFQRTYLNKDIKDLRHALGISLIF
jgi:hypothetical protein